MKKKILLILCIVSFCFNTYADEKNIIVQYQEKSNVVNYKSTINNDKTDLIIDNSVLSFDIKDANKENLLVIKTNSDAKKWLSSIYGDNNYYYASVVSNNSFDQYANIKKINTIKDITIYDTNGQIVENNNINLSELYFSFNKEKINENKILLSIEGNGKVIIDGKIFEKTTEIYTNQESTIILMANEGYILDGILINDKEYKNISNNKFNYSFINKDNIKVIFKEYEEDISDDVINISGYIYLNNNPVQNAKLILHSTEKITYTNNKGYYEFNDVNIGKHELLIVSEEENTLGYGKFEIVKDDNNTIKIINNNKVENLDGNNINMNVNILDNYDIRISDIYSLNSEVQSDNHWIIYIVLTILLLLFVIIILIKRKSKKNNR